MGPPETFSSGSEGFALMKTRLEATVLPFFFPPFVAVGLIALGRGIVLSVANRSLPDAALYVVLPLVVWWFAVRTYREYITVPTMGPRFLYSIMALTYVTFLVRLQPYMPLLQAFFFHLFGLGLVTCFTLTRRSDPGRIPLGPPNPLPQQREGDGLLKEEKTTNGDEKSTPDIELGLSKVAGLEPLGSVLPTLPTAEESESLLPPPSSSAPATFITASGSPFTALRCDDCNVQRWRRSRHCKRCRRCTDRFDHHCPAVGNCIGRKNHTIFLAMLVTFIGAEIAFLRCTVIYMRTKGLLELPAATKVQIGSDALLIGPMRDIHVFFVLLWQCMKAEPWLVLLCMFDTFQLLWETPLLLFHCYLACVNLTTNEFANWRKNPFMHTELPPEPGRFKAKKLFVNPYNRGPYSNLKAFFLAQDVEGVGRGMGNERQ